MMTIRKNNEETKEYFEKLPKVYLIVRWVDWGILDFPLEEIHIENDKVIPVVWEYNDHNGETDRYELVPYNRTTSGEIFTWTIDRDAAVMLVYYLRDLKKKYK